MTSCLQCAHGLEEGQVVCPVCGTAVAASSIQVLDPTSSVVPAAAEVAPISPPMFSTPNALEGIGGWLILIAIGLAASPLYILGSAVSADLKVLMSPRAAVALGAYPGLQAFIEIELILNLASVAFLAILNVLFYSKRRRFPPLFALLMGWQVLLVLGDAIAAHSIMPNLPVSPAAATGIFRTLVAAAIWIPYMFVSSRVKATFVR